MLTRNQVRAEVLDRGPDPAPEGYGIDPTRTDHQYWLTLADTAYRRRDVPMLAWLWRWAPDTGDLLRRIDGMGDRATLTRTNLTDDR